MWHTDADAKQPGAAQVGSLLTTSPIAIPGAVYQERDADEGLLVLGTSSVQLTSTDPTARAVRRSNPN
ncbi:hypothetical protein ACF07Y_35995 [Streptomyces sp. NPDC016566]|uniref:hypothetical protein n=1 Tax=unclassified Streptomyces TaxID=2593676 RepID=UPI0016493B05|nr:hypothetical protein [Streptomyces sp. BK340]